MARILVIDDDRSLLRMMKLMLEKAGHESILASSGREGIQSAMDEQPDLAIVDVMMPELSGYDVCRQLRENPATANIPLLILTARSQPMDQQMAIDAGADDFLSKPITREELMRHLSRLLESGATTVPRPLEPQVEPLPAEPMEQVEPVDVAEPQAAMPAQEMPVTDIFVEDTTIILPVIAVMSLRGGSGATTVAINLALGVMQHGRSCIVDLADAPGHVAVQLQLTPSTNWLNLVNAGPQPDPKQIGASLMMHASAGVAVMAAPATYTTERPSTQTLRHVFQVLSEGFKRIVVDLPAKIDPTSEVVLRMASHVVLVVGDDLAVLRTASESFRAIEALNLTAQQHIVLNRTRPGGVSFEEAQLALGREIEIELPYEPDQTAATAQGRPLVMSSPASVFSQNILHLARML